MAIFTMKNKLIGAWNFHEVLNHSEIWFKKIVDINMIKYSGGAESLRSFQYYREELKKKKYLC